MLSIVLLSNASIIRFTDNFLALVDKHIKYGISLILSLLRYMTETMYYRVLNYLITTTSPAEVLPK